MLSKFIGRFDNSLLEDMDEFNKRYLNTYLFVHINQNPELFYVNSVTAERVILTNEERGPVILSKDTDVTIEVRWPERGLFNYDNGFYWCARIPDRQWKRAIVPKNMRFENLLSNFYSDVSPPTFGLPLLSAAFAPSIYIGLEEACKSLFDGSKWGLALNRTWGITYPPTDKKLYSDFILWRERVPVAVVKYSTRTITVKVKSMVQELQDFNRYLESNKWKLLIES